MRRSRLQVWSAEHANNTGGVRPEVTFDCAEQLTAQAEAAGAKKVGWVGRRSLPTQEAARRGRQQAASNATQVHANT